MQRREPKLVEDSSSNNAFTGYIEESHLTGLLKLVSRFGLSGTEELTPKQQDMSPYKLHVSLAGHEYGEHKDKINGLGMINPAKRIASVKLSDDQFEISRRKQVVLEQENSALYKSLNRGLLMPSSLHGNSMFPTWHTLFPRSYLTTTQITEVNTLLADRINPQQTYNDLLASIPAAQTGEHTPESFNNHIK